jgi:putative transposase
MLLRTHWILLVMDVCTRRLIGFGVERGPIDGVSVCRMFNRAIAGQPLPKRLSTDHDPLFRFHRWKANLRVLGIEEVKSVAYAPVSHPFIERLIGTIRREYLDQTFFWDATDLARKLGLAVPSSWPVPDPGRRLISNSPRTVRLPLISGGFSP